MPLRPKEGKTDRRKDVSMAFASFRYVLGVKMLIKISPRPSKSFAIFLAAIFILEAVCLLLPKAATSKDQQRPLVVYTYKTFISSWGPGKALQERFEKEFACPIKWVVNADGAAMWSRLQWESQGGRKSEADLLLGLDNHLLSVLKDSPLLRAYTPKQTAPLVPVLGLPPPYRLVPIDYGYYAVLYDSRKSPAYGSWQDLLAARSRGKELILPDPRSSTVGLGLIAWFKALFTGGEYEKRVKELQGRTLTLTKGWAEAYSLFLKGEGTMVLSYTLSEAYHRHQQEKPYIKAMVFQQGHPLQVEGVGLVQKQDIHPLAEAFVDFLLREDSQKIIAESHWMYPINPATSGLPSALILQEKPPQLPLALEFQRSEWVKEWIALSFGN